MILTKQYFIYLTFLYFFYPSYRYKLQCTLFGTYVDELNTFLATGETANVVVSIQLAKVKVFQGIITYHINNVFVFVEILSFIFYYVNL